MKYPYVVPCLFAALVAFQSASARGVSTVKVSQAPPQASPQTPKDPWPRLAQKLKTLDETTPGSLGVYLGRPDGGPSLYQGGKHAFYLSSTTKVPVAIVLLKKVEAGELSLDEELTLQQSDYVDGAGDLQRTAPGTRFTIGTLLEKMLVSSDSSATDMLIRRLTEKEIDQTLAAIEPGFGPITTILQVRYDAYGELHPRARELSNLDFIAFKKAGAPEARLQAFAQRLGLQVRDLRLPSVNAAFEAYYRTGKNSAPLDAFGRLLAKLGGGQLLSAEHTQLMLTYMNEITTGSRRVQAGLPKGVRFAQKTGTQVGRLCNVGLLYPRSGTAPLALATCLERHPDQAEGEKVFKRVGELVGRSGLL